jgi:nitrogen-specific signal transduction histidine kinase
MGIGSSNQARSLNAKGLNAKLMLVPIWARSRGAGGAGVGLAMVHAIVVRHSGAIAVDGSPTLLGARFTIHLLIAIT